VIDLHTHTTASDGLLEPAALLDRAHQNGVTTLAITDHDTAAALRELAGRALPLELIAGIEVSSSVGESELHILGYFLDPFDEGVLAYEAERKRIRETRIARMVEQLARNGIPITIEDVRAEMQGGGNPGRPHLARALVKKGLAKDTRDCFDRLLTPGGPGFVAYEKVSAAEGVALIGRAGGVAVIAHPALDGVHAHLDALRPLGFRGIEVWHSAHTPADQARFEAYAREHGLVMTGGSDFHGPGLKEGADVGGVACAPAALEALRRAAGRG